MDKTERLIKAATEYVKHYRQTSGEYAALLEAVQPFLPKKPRVGALYIAQNSIADMPKAVELTPEVRTRLSATAGVDRGVMYQLVLWSKCHMTGEESAIMTDAIMQLIDKGKVEYEAE